MGYLSATPPLNEQCLRLVCCGGWRPRLGLKVVLCPDPDSEDFCFCPRPPEAGPGPRLPWGLVAEAPKRAEKRDVLLRAFLSTSVL